MMRAVGYLRVSTEEQAREDRASLGQQRALCDQLAAQCGVTIERWFTDAGVSGGTAEKRRDFMALVEYCRAQGSDRRQVGLVLVLNDSRWGRFENPEESTYWRVLLQKTGWHVRFAEGDDTEDPIARPVLRSLHSGQASAYRAAIKANAKRGARGSAAAGYWLNEAPIGYRRLAIARDGRTRVLEPGQRKADDERSRLTPGPPAEVRLIRRLFAAYATGRESFGTLLRLGLRAMPAKRWSRPVIRAILTNPAYVGDVVWCRRPHDELERRQVPVRAASEWVIARDAHPALVTRERFAEVAAVLRRNFRARRVTAGGYPLSGLITCGHCGQPFTGKGGPTGPAGDPDRYRMYGHQVLGTRHAEAPNVPCPYLHGILPRRIVEPQVLALLERHLADPRVLKEINRQVDLAFRRLGSGSEARKEELERERAAIVQKRDRLVNLAAEGVLSREDIAGKLAEFRAATESIDLQLHQLRFAASRLRGSADVHERIRTMAQSVASTARKLSGTALRELIRPWLQSAIVDRVTNTLRVTFEPIPAIPQLAVVIGSPGPDNHYLKSRPIVRTVPLPPLRVKRRKRSA